MLRGALRHAWVYLLFVAGIWAAVWWVRPDEDSIPPRTGSIAPDVVVRDLIVPATAEHVGFEAAVARPTASGGPVTIGGLSDALALERVRAELSPGLWLRGAKGRFAGGVLVVEGNVGVEREGRRVLTATRVDMTPAALQFRGLVVLGDSGREVREVDLATTAAELVQRLR